MNFKSLILCLSSFWLVGHGRTEAIFLILTGQRAAGAAPTFQAECFVFAKTFKLYALRSLLSSRRSAISVKLALQIAVKLALASFEEHERLKI